MSKIKSFSVGNGDMFYIKHGSDNFTVIDCNLVGDNKSEIMDEIIRESKSKGVSRFISTHPDEDHIHGLEYFCSRKQIVNFYCVKNKATKDDETTDFKKYCEHRDSGKAYYISKGCTRKWINSENNERKSSGISILWPNTENDAFKEQLELIEDGNSPNNISPIIKYGYSSSIRIMWMGDIESDFLTTVKDDIDFEEISILFAPHHGRSSGKVPKDVLKILNPKLIIVGEAPSKDLEYYGDYNTITQNSAGDITFVCENNKIHIYVSSSTYSVDFLTNEYKYEYDNYIGTLIV